MVARLPNKFAQFREGIMGLFKKNLPGILKGFHKTIKHLDDLNASHTAEIDATNKYASDLRSMADDVEHGNHALDAERMNALAIKEKIAGLIGA